MDIKNEIEELTNKVRIYQDAYYKEGKSIVSDTEYDRLFDLLLSLEKKYPEFSFSDSPTRRVGSDLTQDFPEIRHSIPVLSLDKAYSENEVLSFFDKSIRKEGGQLSFVAEEKIDGISMVLYYENGSLERAVTRGNGEVGNDVTANIMTLRAVPLRLNEKINIAVRGEVYLPKKDFAKINEKLSEDERAANPRNLASGTVRRQKSEDAARVPLNMFCYEGFWEDDSATPKDHLSILKKLKDLGFRINTHLAYFASSKKEAEERLNEVGIKGDACSFSSLSEYLNKKTEERERLDYEIDGLVFKINELNVRKEFGYTEHHPRWAVAYKFVSPQAESVLLGITCQVGRTGRITPVAEIKPVSLGGSTIKRATLHNQEYINELELAIGDSVSITKRGDVIPAVEEVTEKNNLGNTTYKIPRSCPSCSSPLVEVGAHLFCENKDCPEKIKGRLSFFSSRDQMDIEGLGPKTVGVLYDIGLLRNLDDIYKADYEKLRGLEGFGDKSIEALKKGIEESKKRPFSTVLTSLGLKDFGKKNVELLIKAGFDRVEKIIESAKKKDRQIFTSIKGIGESGAETIINEFNNEDEIKLIYSLKNLGLNMEEKKKEEETDDTFLGEVWVVTGSFDFFNPRSLALKEIEKRGGKTSSSISGKTTHLLVGKGGGGKRAEAEKYGVTLVTEEEFLKLLNKGEKIEKKEKPKQGELF